MLNRNIYNTIVPQVPVLTSICLWLAESSITRLRAIVSHRSYLCMPTDAVGSPNLPRMLAQPFASVVCMTYGGAALPYAPMACQGFALDSQQCQCISVLGVCLHTGTACRAHGYTRAACRAHTSHATSCTEELRESCRVRFLPPCMRAGLELADYQTNLVLGLRDNSITARQYLADVIHPPCIVPVVGLLRSAPAPNRRGSTPCSDFPAIHTAPAQ